MCRIFASQPPEAYTSESRSVRLGGHVTSVRLEAAFWAILEEIADSEGITVPKFLTQLHDEVLQSSAQDYNFASLLRCSCLTYVTKVKGRVDADRGPKENAPAHMVRAH